MKSAFSPQRVFSQLEPLEARIAPAVIFVGDPTTSSDNYTENPLFVNTESGADSISAAVGPGEVGQDDTFYLKMSAGDELRLFTSASFQPYLKINSGSLVAFFQDLDGDNEMDAGELVSLSLGKDASVTLFSGLAGSVVTNYDEKNDTVLMDGLVSSSQGINNLDIKRGDVVGSILSGGDISKVTMNGRVTDILAGSAANGATFEVFPGIATSKGTISFTPEAGVKGASISNIFIDAVGNLPGEGRIEAGAGGDGANGGSLKNIRLTEDFDGFLLKAGNGGATDNGAKGGNGGTVKSITISGVQDGSANDLIQIRSGLGGDSESGVGGKGGAVSKVLIGYDLFGNRAFESGNLLADTVQIESGAGGGGKTGGKGGVITDLDIRVSTLDVAGQDEVTITAGVGGAGKTGGKAGDGGSLSKLKISNASLGNASVLLQGGNGGAAETGAVGAAGGSISNSTLLSGSILALAGNGSTGTVGGSGGSLTKLNVDQLVIAHIGVFNAGFGGNGTEGKGGNGGTIDRLVIENGDFFILDINSGSAANGGASIGGKGGAGGSVTKLSIVEGDFGAGGSFGTMNLRSGDGGDGTRKGGNGGALTSVDFTAEDLAADVRSGSGGSVVGVDAVGKGGEGGSIRGARIITEGFIDIPDESTPDDPDDVISINVGASIKTGEGGAGAGAKGHGGAAGDIKKSLVNVQGNASVVAGNGGNGAENSGNGGTAGQGGSIVQVGVFATLGSSELLAGDGGAEGDRPGNGGSIVGRSSIELTGVYAAQNVTIAAGDGTNGGAGGTVRNVGYGSTASDLLPTPAGNILVQGGHGSADGRFAGSGGSIINVMGSVGSASGTLTQFNAGNGGGNENTSAAGGSIVDLRIQRGGSPLADGVPVELRILAGDGGDGGQNVQVGAKGGDVRNVRIFEISSIPEGTDTIIRSIAAGNGGDATARGGVGGSLNEIRVLDHDIGIRSGAAYGYESMGGLFAGAGGAAATKGLSGDVTHVTAKAIAAIVAGRGELPEMVDKVEFISLFSTRPTGLGAVNLLELEPQPGRPSDLNTSEDPAGLDGWYAFRPEAYQNDNLVGAVFEPYRTDGNKFAFVNNNAQDETDDAGENEEPIFDYDFSTDKPIDGLIAARVFNQATVNFTPEARVVDGVFYDYDNRNA